MSLVLDSSLCLAWCFEDERTSEVLAVRERVIEAGATVPPLWRYEVANALLMAQRRKPSPHRAMKKRRAKLCVFAAVRSSQSSREAAAQNGTSARARSASMFCFRPKT